MDTLEKLARQAAETINGGEFYDGKWYTEGQREAWRKAMTPAADEIERLRQLNAELVKALNHCINGLTEFEKDSNLPIVQFQYSVVFKLKGYLLGALDNARQVTRSE